MEKYMMAEKFLYDTILEDFGVSAEDRALNRTFYGE